jgi:hypothetical protein
MTNGKRRETDFQSTRFRPNRSHQSKDQPMSAEEAYIAFQSIEHKLAPGSLRDFIAENLEGMASCPVALLPGLIESRLALPQNSRFLKPAHEPGSIDAMAAEARDSNRGGLFGPANPNAKLAPMPAPIGHFQPLGETLASPSTDASVMQRMELISRGKVRGDERLNTSGFFQPTAPSQEYALPTGQAVASREGSMFGKQPQIK